MGRQSLIIVVALVLLTTACAASSPRATNRPSGSAAPASASAIAAPTIYTEPSWAIDGDPSCLVSRSDHDLDYVPRGRLDPGTYSYCGIGGTYLNVQFTVPAGWEWQGSYLSKSTSVEEARITFLMGDVQVYTDPCRWSSSEPDPPTGPTVADLIDALAAQPMRGASTPTERYAYQHGADRSLPPTAQGPGVNDWTNGYMGMAIELTVPDDIDTADCDEGQFRSWGGPTPSVRAHQGPGQRDLVWVVTSCPEGRERQASSAGCVNYERLVIDASWMPATPPNVVTEIEAILESIATGHWG